MNNRLEAFSSYGFRPFFLMGGIYAVIVITPWAMHFLLPEARSLAGLRIPTAEWHAHEMLFGYTSAIIAGFFLTAVPNWTGRKPVSGIPLMVLACLWLMGRLVNWFPDLLPQIMVAVIDCAFIPMLLAMVIRALTAGWSKRNLIFLPLFIGLFAANVMVQLDWMGITEGTAQKGHRLALDLIITLIIILGGRVIPAFTTNYLHNSGEKILPRQSDILTRLAIVSATTMIIINQVAPDTFMSGVVMVFVAAVNAVRLAGWRGHRILRVPILWVLFLGYGFVVLGLAAGALAIFTDWIPINATDHLLTIGGIGCMTTGIMARAGLGHTGRKPHASPVMIAAFLALPAAALLRTVGPELWPSMYPVIMAAVGVLWFSAFSAFSITFWPILTRPRIGQ